MKHPLIHNITNYVAMNFAANCLLGIGASPIMARAIEIIRACHPTVIKGNGSMMINFLDELCNLKNHE